MKKNSKNGSQIDLATIFLLTFVVKFDEFNF
jgi:hypothetical protein